MDLESFLLSLLTLTHKIGKSDKVEKYFKHTFFGGGGGLIPQGRAFQPDLS